MKKILLVCVLAMCAVVWAEDKNQAEPQKEKPDYRSVIVDAWLVRVDADALAESGVKPLSEKDKENVSVMNLMWCLSDPNKGEVMASAATKARNYEDAKTKSEKIEYIKWSRRPNSVEVTPYSSETSFINQSDVLDSKKIRIEFSFKATDYYIEEPNMPAIEYKIEFNNISILSDKKSAIVAQSQTGGDMFFLVMKAEIVE